MKILIREEELRGWSSTGLVFRAYRDDGTPLYIGAETAEECRQLVLSYHPDAVIELEHQHTAVSVTPAASPPGLRRTGVFQLETCSCGMTRHVWITSFKVDAGAWQ